MANTKSAAKRARQTVKRTERNKAVLTRVKTLKKKARKTVESGDQAAAHQAVQKLSSTIDKAVKTGRVHRNTANRTKSRLSKKLAAASTPKAS